MKDWFLRSAMEQIAVYSKLKEEEGSVAHCNGAMYAMADAISLYLIHQYPDVNYAILNNKEDYDTYISFKVYPDEHYNEMMDLLKKYFQ